LGPGAIAILLPPNLGLASTCHEALFDELKASAYVQKGAFCGFQNMPKCVSGLGVFGISIL